MPMNLDVHDSERFVYTYFNFRLKSLIYKKREKRDFSATRQKKIQKTLSTARVKTHDYLKFSKTVCGRHQKVHMNIWWVNIYEISDEYIHK